jgi:hypothetical protein
MLTRRPVQQVFQAFIDPQPDRKRFWGMVKDEKIVCNTLREIRAAYNSGLAKGGLTCFVATFVQGSIFVLKPRPSPSRNHSAQPKKGIRSSI